ncbi:MAG: phage Omnicron, partial [Actinomycetota bacterium]
MSIYSVPPGTVLDAALDYIARGWWLLPVAGQRGGDAGARWKAPYGIGRWSVDSSRDEATIRAWFEGNDDLGIGLDMGRSGLVALDGDQHALLVEWAGAENLEGAPSWHGHPARRSYLFQQPADGDPIGCPVREWGEIRGIGGFMVIPPSPHPIGGRYKWDTIADPFPLPEVLAEQLRAVASGSPSLLVSDATVQQVAEFMEAHTEQARPTLLDNILAKYREGVESGAGRYPTLRDCLVWAMEEAATGMFSARDAATLLGTAYREDLSK